MTGIGDIVGWIGRGLLGLYLAILAITVVTYLAHAWDRRRSGEPMFTDGGGFGPDLARWIVGVLRESLATWALALMLPFAYLGAAERRVPGPRAPVLLVHGYGHNASGWLLYRALLARSGWTEIYLVNYPSLVSPIETCAERVAAKVEEILKRSPHDRVDVVAHSMGGIVARYYVHRMGGAKHVRRLVTLGTPHAGVPLAGRLPFDPGRQMAPGGAFLQRLDEGRSLTPGTEIVCFWSRFDNMAVPYRGARVAECPHDVEFDDLGHSALLLSLTVYRELERALERQETA